MAKTPPKDAFERLTNPDGTPVRDQDNAQMRPAPPGLANKPAPNLAPPGMSGIRPSQTRPLAPSFIVIENDIDAGTHRYVTGHVVSSPEIGFLARVSRSPTDHGINGSRVDQLVLKEGAEALVRHNFIASQADLPPQTQEQRAMVDRICEAVDMDKSVQRGHSERAPETASNEERHGVAPSFQDIPSGISTSAVPNTPWIEGKILSMPGYTFHAKVFDAPSQHGIEGGTISKLDVRKDDALVMRYDRGWDIDPKTTEQKEALHRIRNGLGDMTQKEFKGFDHKHHKDQGMER